MFPRFSILIASIGHFLLNSPFQIIDAQGSNENDLQFDYYDVGAYEGFYVYCGTLVDPYMKIYFAGEVRRVYAEDDPEFCDADEVAPSIWRIDINNYNHTDCPVEYDSEGSIGGPLWSLTVVAQKTLVRQWDDEYRQITCNYGLGGTVNANQTRANTSVADNVPMWKTVRKNKTDLVVHLYVYDVYSEAVDTITLGDYIQLRAHVQSYDDNVNPERSIRIHNCRAFSGDQSYYFIIQGCGDGEIVESDRGFRMEKENTGNVKVTSVSRSTYFKSFQLPAKDTLTFQCDYTICQFVDCMKYTCDSKNRTRRKRDVPQDFMKYRGSRNLPSVLSNTILILPPKDEVIVSTNDLILAEGPSNRMPTYQTGVAEVGESAQLFPEDLDLMTVGLVVGLVFLALVLLATLACALMVCYRDRQALYRKDHGKALLLSRPATQF